jgi:multiple sugar transport system substrate-binding protein
VACHELTETISAGENNASTRDTDSLTVLRGITWDHPRGVDCLKAASEEFSQHHPNVQIDWTARPLREFEDTPIAELATRYDLLAIDHPHIGDAVEQEALLALDSRLPASDLDRRAEDSPGPSHASYSWRGHQWALAVDAACQVSAYRPDLLEKTQLPGTWKSLEHLAAECGPERIALAANPTHLWCTLLSLCEASAKNADRGPDGRPMWWGDEGISPAIMVKALRLLKKLLSMCAPASLQHDPISLLDQMSESDDYLYSPLVFGYVTYAHSRPGKASLRFTGPPSADGTANGTITGGVGLAISAGSKSPNEAAEFLSFVTSARCQGSTYLTAGGQPGRRSVWTDPAANGPVEGFFADTLRTMDRSFLRPRRIGYPDYQHHASELLHEMFVCDQQPEAIVPELTRLWKHHVI